MWGAAPRLPLAGSSRLQVPSTLSSRLPLTTGLNPVCYGDSVPEAYLKALLASGNTFVRANKEQPLRLLLSFAPRCPARVRAASFCSAAARYREANQRAMKELLHGIHAQLQGQFDRAWRPDEEPRSTLIFIGHRLSQLELQQAFDACVAGAEGGCAECEPGENPDAEPEGVAAPPDGVRRRA